MAPKLYCIDGSPPVRSVYLTAAALGLKLDLHPIKFLEKEHLGPEFVKLNPQHTVPTLVDDDGTIIWDSHAINTYLISKYGKDDSLYPKDLALRAKIDQRLHFDSGLVFPGLRRITVSAHYLKLLYKIIFQDPILYGGKKNILDDSKEYNLKTYEFLETFLKDDKWMVGNNLTVADMCLIPSITSLSGLVPIDENKFPNLTAYIKRAEELPYYDLNKKGLEDFVKLIYTAHNICLRSKMAPKLYYINGSPPVSSVYMTAAALQLELNSIPLNLHRITFTIFFAKTNKLFTFTYVLIILIDEDGTIIWDSHAINTYLISKYGKDDSLYPKDLILRAKIDQRLHFDSGLAYPGVRRISEPILFFGKKTIPEDLKAKNVKTYEFLETFLKDSKWMVVDNLTVADLCLIPSITSMNVLVPIDPNKFPKLIAYVERADGLPYYNFNKKGVEAFKQYIESNLKS
ncbi:hypothetical protein FQA39_LY14583 [Lamprigera yunnana]|nr:hypothetical protein FQA39_LY14583 [Lamprigera yunnana]